MPLTLDLSRLWCQSCSRWHGLYQPSCDRPADATQARLLAGEAERIVRQYGPAAVLQATADALSYYQTTVQAGEPGSSTNGREAITQAVRELRQAQDALRREAAEFLR